MFDIEKTSTVRREFEALDPVNYFNTALTAVLPRCVEEAVRFEQERFQSSFGSEDGWDEERAAARAGIARMIGATPDDIALLSNTVEGIGLIVGGYPWDARRKVALFTGEHPSNRLPWIMGARAGKFRLRPIQASNVSLSTQDVLDGLDGDVQALALSFVQYSDGAMVDIARIGEECKKRGILFIVDGIQAIGRMMIDVEAMHIDYMSCGAHKGLLVRNGIGFVYCRRAVLDVMQPIIASGMSVAGSTPADMLGEDAIIPWCDSARKLENGNRSHQGVYSLIAATKLLNGLGAKDIQEEITALQARLVQQLGEDAKKLLPRCGAPSGIVRVNFPREKRAEVVELLAQRKIYSTVRDSNVRFCIDFFNTPAQIDELAKAIKEIPCEER